jgi:hypothetical protein
MAIEFYDVKTRSRVSVDEGKVRKTVFNLDNGQTRYGLRGETEDGRPLTKFVSKANWDEYKFPEVKLGGGEADKAEGKAKSSKKADAPAAEEAPKKKATSKKK